MIRIWRSFPSVRLRDEPKVRFSRPLAKFSAVPEVITFLRGRTFRRFRRMIGGRKKGWEGDDGKFVSFSFSHVSFLSGFLVFPVKMDLIYSYDVKIIEGRPALFLSKAGRLK